MSKRKLVLVAVAVAIGFHVCHRTVQQVVSSGRSSAVIVGHDNMLVRLASRLIDLDWDDDPFQISGHVTDHDHEPVGGATVTLDGVNTVTTAADGTFAFEDVEIGHHTLTAEKGDDYGETAGADNHPTIELRGGPAVVVHVVDDGGQPVTTAIVWGYGVNEHSTEADGTVHLHGLGFDSILLNVDAIGFAETLTTVPLGDDPRRTIDHRVVMQHAVPVGGVVLDQDDKPVANASVWIGGSTQTGSDGTWRVVPGIAPGKHMLVASADGYAQRAMQEIEIEKGKPRMDLVLHIDRSSETIGGVVVDASGAPVAHPLVSVKRVDRELGFWPTTVESDEHGKFTIQRLAAAKYEIHAASATLSAPPQTVTLERGAHVELRFVVSQPAGISGIVVDDLGQPAVGVTVTPHEEVGATAVADAVGHFQLSGLPDGSYALETWRYLDLEERATHVTAHTGDTDVRIVSPRPGSLTGRVVMNGQPVDYFGMTLTDETTKVAELVPVHDPDGRFTKPKLGQRVFSVSIAGPGFEPKLLAHVHVKPGEQLDLGDIAVTAGRVLRGRVVDRSGSPIADATVVARPDASIDGSVTLANARDRRPGTRTDSVGRFQLAGLPDDIIGYQIQASTAGALAPPRELSPADLDHDIELVLDAAGSITGTLVDEAGKPSHGTTAVVITRGMAQYTAAVDRDGGFSLAPLPVGDYLVSPSHVTVAPTAIHVDAGAATTIALTVPSQRVGVDVAVDGAACTTIDVSSPLVDDARPIVSAPCNDGHHAAFELAPGEYKLCAGAACVVSEFTAGPRAQVTITAE